MAVSHLGLSNILIIIMLAFFVAFTTLIGISDDISHFIVLLISLGLLVAFVFGVFYVFHTFHIVIRNTDAVATYMIIFALIDFITIMGVLIPSKLNYINKGKKNKRYEVIWGCVSFILISALILCFLTSFVMMLYKFYI
jgi:hypothetical protein